MFILAYVCDNIKVHVNIVDRTIFADLLNHVECWKNKQTLDLSKFILKLFNKKLFFQVVQSPGEYNVNGLPYHSDPPYIDRTYGDGTVRVSVTSQQPDRQPEKPTPGGSHRVLLKLRQLRRGKNERRSEIFAGFFTHENSETV